MTSRAAPAAESAAPTAFSAQLSVFSGTVLPLLFVVAGIVLRIQRYLLGRSFRQDEAALALAMQFRSILDLIHEPLPGGLTAPVGFLVLQKSIVALLGNFDYVHRLLPLLAGCASAALMYLLARQVLGQVGAIFAVAVVALNWMLIFYSSDFKQYSSDVTITIVIYLVAARYLRADTAANAVLLAVTGIVSVALSHPAIFLLAAAAPVLVFHGHRTRKDVLTGLAISLLWAMAFLILYFYYYRVVGEDRGVVDYWNNLDGLMPIPPWKNPGWFLIRSSSYFTAVMGLSVYTLVNVALYGLGIASFVGRRQWEWAVLLLGSTLMTLAAAAVFNYPFKGRLILFLVPSTLLAMGEGLDWLAALVKQQPWFVRALPWIALGLMIWSPVLNTYRFMSSPRYSPYKEDIKPVLAFVRDHWQPQDMVVVYSGASITYRYYAPFYGLQDAPTLPMEEFRNHPLRYRKFVDALPREQRVWFVFSAVLDTKDGPDVRTYLLDYISQSGGSTLEQFTYDNVSMTDLVILK